LIRQRYRPASEHMRRRVFKILAHHLLVPIDRTASEKVALDRGKYLPFQWQIEIVSSILDVLARH